MKPYMKFGLLMAIIIGTLAWLAIGGVNETKTYYKTVSELKAMGPDAYSKRLRVAGDVAPNSIQRNGNQVRFTLVQQTETIDVIYEGSDPLPDTFRDNAQAVADGRLGEDGVFRAAKIQAKCASKYEAKPGQNPGYNPAIQGTTQTKAAF